MTTIEINDVTKTFGKHTAVDHLSLNVPAGSVYGFIGPNGSGKTTSLRMIMNIFFPDSGEILVFGEHLKGSATDRIGYMPEERGLYKRMRVRELLQFFADLKNTPDAPSLIDRWLEEFDLTQWANKKVETLSKGMSQKVQFIATVVSRPELLLLDEPFTGLDPVNTDIMKDAILDLQKQGTTVIFSTHDMSMAEKMCDFIFMIFKGKKVLDGTLSSIQDTYGHDTLRIKTDDGLAALENLEGVEKVNDFGQLQELRMAPHADSNRILAQLLQRTRIKSFDMVKPSLHDIFVRIAGTESPEVTP